MSASWLPRELRKAYDIQADEVAYLAQVERIFGGGGIAVEEKRGALTLKDAGVSLPGGADWPIDWPEVTGVKDYGCCALTSVYVLDRAYGKRWISDPSIVYIGRLQQYASREYGTTFANPFPVDALANRELSILRYRDYITKERPFDVLMQIPNLVGKVLACHCTPKSCHGEVIAELVQSVAYADGIYDTLCAMPMHISAQITPTSWRRSGG